MDVHIEEYRELLKVRFYVLRSAQETESELQLFFKYLLTSGKRKDQRDLSDLKYWIQVIGNERGAVEDLFRNERSAEALPPSSVVGNRLRLYCIRCSDDIVILGGGGHKPKSQQKAETGHETAYPFEMVNEVARILRGRIKRGRIWISGKALQGDFRKINLPNF